MQEVAMLIELIEYMRKCQRAFFEARKKNLPEATRYLELSKNAEKQVDDFCKEFRKQEAAAKAPELF